MRLIGPQVKIGTLPLFLRNRGSVPIRRSLSVFAPFAVQSLPFGKRNRTALSNGVRQQRNPELECGTPQSLIQRGKGSSLAHGQFQVGGIIDGKLVLPGKSKGVAPRSASGFLVSLKRQFLKCGPGSRRIRL